ncbi:MAG: hypothetical protein IJU11_04205 [Prevotella sp.]|nr:hypothetical protein [Prevotella sp.]
MKKTLLLFVALVASIGAWAQNNVTNGKTVVPLGGLKTYTTEDGTKQYTISETDLQKITVEGNTNNVYLFPETDGPWNTDANKAIGIQGFYIDLGSAQAVSNIQTTWEGAAASYKVYLTDTEPAADGTLTGATEIADYTESKQETTKNVAVSSDATGRYIVCVPQEATNYGWGVKIRTFVALDKAQAVLGSLTVTPAFAEAGGTQTFTASALSTTGVAISEGVTYTFDGVASDLQNVSVSAGEHTIVATYNGNTAEAKVYGITVPAAPEATTIQAALFANDGTATAGTTGFINYDRGTSGAVPTEVTIGSSKVKYAVNAGKLFINNGDVTANINNTWTNKGEKNYKTLSVDLWSATAQSGNLVINDADGATKNTGINMAAATWTTVQVSIEDLTTVGNISIQLDAVEGSVYPDFLIANVYMLNISTEANPFNITAAGVVTGNVSAANADAINAVDAMLIDLTGVNAFTEAVTLSPKNPNALIKVAGTVEGGVATADIKYANLTANNQVVIDTYVFPVAKLQFTDANDNKFWDGEGTTQNFISTGSNGYSITRSIASKKYVTAATAAAVTVPEGIEVYEFTYYEVGTVTFTKKADNQLTAKTPYVLYNTTDAAIDLVVEGTGDLNLHADAQTVERGVANFVANLTELTTGGTQYILSGDQIKKGNGAKVGVFRAYFTGVAAANGARVQFIDGDVTKIGAIDADGQLNVGEFYNLSGQRVQNPTKGLYIVNGKKVIIK